jgi:hypothetical protein
MARDVAPLLHRYCTFGPVAAAVSDKLPPWQKVVLPPTLMAVEGSALIVIEVLAVAAAQPLAAARLFVTVYVPGRDVAKAIAPVCGFRLNPVGVALNVPPVAPVPKLGDAVVVVPAQKLPLVVAA